MLESSLHHLEQPHPSKVSRVRVEVQHPALSLSHLLEWGLLL